MDLERESQADEEASVDWWGRIGCGLLIVVVLTVYAGLPYLSIKYFQPDAEEEILAQSQIDLRAVWRLAKIASWSLLAAVIASAVLFLLTRWRRIRVFITYQHDLKERVRVMCEQLRAHGVRSWFIPFDTRAEHDDVLRRVLDGIRSADLVITVPGSQPSFVDAEILSATTLQKPLLIVTGEHVGRRLGTAFEGYPRFSMRMLEKGGYRPLAELIHHVCNHWSSAWNVIGMGVRAFCWVWSGAGALLVVGHFLLDVVTYLVTLVSIETALEIDRLELHAITVVVIVATLGAFAMFGLAVAGRIRARRISRQTTLTGKSTYKKLKTALEDSMPTEELVDCLLDPFGDRRGHEPGPDSPASISATSAGVEAKEP